MGKMTLASSFLWKCGFLAPHSQCILHSNDLIAAAVKGQENSASPDIPLVPTANQQNFATSNPIAENTTNTATEQKPQPLLTNPGEPYDMQEALISKVNEGMTQILNMHSKAMTPHMTHLHNEGHLHCTLLICGLPLEEPNYQPCTETMMHLPFQWITEIPSETLDQKYPVKPGQQHSNHKAQWQTSEPTWLASETVMRSGVNKAANQELKRWVQ